MNIIPTIVLLIAFTAAQANSTDSPSEAAAYDLILTNLIKSGDNPENAACLAFLLQHSGTIDQNKDVINEANAAQVIRMIKADSKVANLLCFYGLTALAISFAVFFAVSILCCCAYCCFIAQTCQSSNQAVISGSKKAIRNDKRDEKVEMYSPRSRMPLSEV